MSGGIRVGGNPGGRGAPERPAAPDPVLVIACGALAREIDALRRSWGWSHLHMRCLPAELHNRPAEIPQRLRRMIREHRPAYASIFVAYADCGTGGGIDRVLAEEGAERLDAGEHGRVDGRCWMPMAIARAMDHRRGFGIRCAQGRPLSRRAGDARLEPAR